MLIYFINTNLDDDNFSDDWDISVCWDRLLSECEGLVDKIGVGCLEQAFQGFDVGSLLRLCHDDARESFKSFKYVRWSQPASDQPSCLQCLLEAGNIRVLAQFI